MYLDKVEVFLIWPKKHIFEVYTASDHGLPQIIYVDPIISSVWHAMVHPCDKYGLIITLLPMYLEKVECVLAKTIYYLCAHKKLSHFDFVYTWINKLKNQRPEIIHISTFLQALDDNQNKIKMS